MFVLPGVCVGLFSIIFVCFVAFSIICVCFVLVIVTFVFIFTLFCLFLGRLSSTMCG